MYKSEYLNRYKDTTAKQKKEFVNPRMSPEGLSLKLKMAKRFTKVYMDNLDKPVAIREALCLNEQYPAICRNIVRGDLFAGRVHFYPLVGYGLEVYPHSGPRCVNVDDIAGDKVSDEVKDIRKHVGSSSTGFYCDFEGLKNAKEILNLEGDTAQDVDDIVDFWWEETSRYKYNQLLPDDIINNTGRTDFDLKLASTFFRIGCTSIDYDKLMINGIPGMKSMVSEKLASVEKDSDSYNLYTGMLMSLDVLVNVCRYYEKQALEMAFIEEDEDYKKELIIMADILEKIQTQKPETTRQGLQLMWLYNLMVGTLNYGRMDEYLGDLYVDDIDSGRTNDEEIITVMSSLYKIMNDMFVDGLSNSPANHRIIVGGKARRNEANADRFAIVAMETARRCYYAEPNVTLRFYKGQNPALYEKALELISEGCIDPSLYNDDAFVPYVKEAFGVDEKEAETYIPQGCGEIVLDHRSIGSPNVIMNYLTLLDIVLHNGYYTVLGEQKGLRLGNVSSFDTFDKLLSAVKEQISFTHDILARRHAIEVEMEGKEVPQLMFSMLYGECIERGKCAMGGGVKYLGAIIESFGITNLADSLYAIKHVVFDKKMMSLEELVAILDNNYDGQEDIRQMLYKLPKFGNDIDEVDEIHTELTNFINNNLNEKGRAAGLDYMLICNLNPGAVSYCEVTKASADGRLYGEPMAMGNAPTAGGENSGITALLNSMLKHDKHHAGYVHNLKVSKALFNEQNRPKLEALLKTYFDNGGIQIMITTLNPSDLQDALENPDKYQNLLVRVAGWTSRYVELEPIYQKEILDRTMFE